MSIGQKLELVADAVYEKGIQDEISNSKYIEKQASGKVIHLDDVSEVAHKVKVKVKKSKNKLDLRNMIGQTVTAEGGTITIQDDCGIALSGTPTGYCALLCIIDNPFEDGIYTISCSGDFTNFAVDFSLRDAQNNLLLQSSISAVTNYSNTFDMGKYPSCTKITFGFKRNANNVPISGTAYMQIEEGTTATPYEPYLEPVESTEVEVYGKNICDYTKFVGITGTDNANVILEGDTFVFPSGNAYFGLNMTNGLSLIKGQTYTFSYNAITSYAYPECKITYTDDTHIIANNGKTVTIEKDVKAILFYISSGQVAETDWKLSKFQVELGAKVTDYELPKNKKTITATLDGVEIPSMCPVMNIMADNDVTVDHYSSFGMNEEWSRFWDVFQDYGNRKVYEQAFYGVGFSASTFYPKYDIVPKQQSRNMFYDWNRDNCISLKQRLNECGVTLDISQCPNVNAMFNYCRKFYEVPVLDFTACTSTTTVVFAYTYADENNCLKIIEKIIVNENNSFTNWFSNANGLEHVIFEGTIASNIDLHWSTLLDRASILSLLQCLKVSITGVVVTLPAKCVDNQTDTLAFIQGDTELNTAYTQALANGYTIAFQ